MVMFIAIDEPYKSINIFLNAALIRRQNTGLPCEAQQLSTGLPNVPIP